MRRRPLRRVRAEQLRRFHILVRVCGSDVAVDCDTREVRREEEPRELKERARVYNLQLKLYSPQVALRYAVESAAVLSYCGDGITFNKLYNPGKLR